MKIIYLDHHSTTPLDARVLKVMWPVMQHVYGNPSSSHLIGSEASRYIERARKQIADLVNATPEEIFFTSGATESNNLALKGLAEIYRPKGRHIITCASEHPSVLEVCAHLAQQGFKLTVLGVDAEGCLSLDDLKQALTDETILISVMSANHETGVLHPIREIGKLARERGVFFHTDASQAAGKIPINVEKDYLDLVSLSAHKMYGPKGVGALYVRRANPRVRLMPLLHGGGHEHALRSGTLNVPAIVGFGEACAVCAERMSADAAHTAHLRDRLKEGLLSKLNEVTVNGSWTKRLPNNLNVSFGYVEAASLLKRTERIAVSSQATCAGSKREPSRVLKAMGLPEAKLHGSIRFGIGRTNTVKEIDFVIQRFVAVVKELRATSPLYKLNQDAPKSISIETDVTRVRRAKRDIVKDN